MATLQEAQNTLAEVKRLADLAASQNKIDVAAGTPQIFDAGMTTPNFSVQAPSITNAQDLSGLTGLKSDIEKLMLEFSEAAKISPETTGLQEKIDEAAVKQAQIDAGTALGIAGLKGEPISKALGQGQISKLETQAATQKEFIANQVLPLELKLRRLEKAQETKLGTLKTRLGFKTDLIDITSKLSKLTRPDVLNTQILESGDIVSITQDPITGAISSQTIGKTTPKAKDKYARIGEQIDSEGNNIVYGITNAGKYEMISKTAGKPIESIVDTRQARTDLADYLAQVPTYKSRDEALQALNQFGASIIIKTGQEGFNLIKVEIDRQFPPPIPATLAAPSSSKGLFSNFFRIPAKPAVPTAKKPLFEYQAPDVGSFFNKLFGE